jgi:uncharacterized protein YdeI (YjbR/CyaY-like superfamily)
MPLWSGPRRGLGKLVCMVAELPELLVPDAAAWRGWLEPHHASSPGIWLVLAKKNTTKPTNLGYDQALEEASCYGWIDGQLGRRDEVTYRQRFTPRRPRSAWSANNVALAERLIAAGRMRPAGLAAVERARQDGRWEAAYAGSASIEVPADLAVALAADPAAQCAFEGLSRLNRFAIIYRVTAPGQPATRARRIERFVSMLARGETIHPPERRGPPQKGEGHPQKGEGRADGGVVERPAEAGSRPGAQPRPAPQPRARPDGSG